MQVSKKLVLLGLLIVTAVSCSADTTSQSASIASPTSPANSVLAATLVGGGDFDIQAALQQSPVALWFWAPG